VTKCILTDFLQSVHIRTQTQIDRPYAYSVSRYIESTQLL